MSGYPKTIQTRGMASNSIRCARARTHTHALYTHIIPKIVRTRIFAATCWAKMYGDFLSRGNRTKKLHNLNRQILYYLSRQMRRFYYVEKSHCVNTKWSTILNSIYILFRIIRLKFPTNSF